MAEELNVNVEAAAPAVKPVSLAASKPLPGGFIWGVGRRKKAIARVRIKAGTGKFLVNKKDVEEFFKTVRDRASARSPLETAKLAGQYDVWANVNGGGTTGQADAIQLGLARALIKVSADLLPAFREQGHLTRDSRMKERKKYGQKGARKRFQFSKR